MSVDRSDPSPSVRRPGKKAIATRARILDAAALTFRTNGYAGTRLSDVAAAAKTQAGSLYYYFNSREDLVEEVLRVGQERTSGHVRRRVAALSECATPLDRLHEAIAAHLDTVLETGDYTSATIRIMSQVPEHIRTRRLHEQREYGQFWRALVEDAQTAGQIRIDLDGSAIRMFLLGAMNSAPEWFRPRQNGLTARAFEKQMSSIFFEGLSTGGAAGRSTGPAKDRSTGQETETGSAPEQAKRALEVEFEAFRTGSARENPRRDELPDGAQRILAAAAGVFREQGYAGARLADVAAAADIQTGSMYHYFSSRDDLVAQLILEAWTRTNSQVRHSVDALPADAAPVQRFSTAAIAHLLSVLEESAFTAALVRILGQVAEPVRERTTGHQRAYLEYWHELLAEAIAAGDIRDDVDVPSTVMMLTGTLNWAAEWYRPGGRLTATDLAGEVINLVLDGLSPAPAG